MMRTFPTPFEKKEGKVDPGSGVGPSMAALVAIERALRKGTLATRPEEDADRIAAAARRHGLGPVELAAAAADIRDWTRRPEGPLAQAVWKVLGDPGADVLELALRLLGSDTATGSSAAATDDERNRRR